MIPVRLCRDCRGTATIEFGLILPIMVLLVLGLADTVRRNLAMMDVDAAVNSGTAAALRHGYDGGRIAAAMAATAGNARPVSVDLINCHGKSTRTSSAAEPDRKPGQRKRKKGRSNRGGAGDRVKLSDCGGLPGGRYVSVTASARVPSLLAPMQSPTIARTAIVRLP